MGSLRNLDERTYTSSELQQMVNEILPENKKDDLKKKGKPILTMHLKISAVSVSMHFISEEKFRSQHV